MIDIATRQRQRYIRAYVRQHNKNRYTDAMETACSFLWRAIIAGLIITTIAALANLFDVLVTKEASYVVPIAEANTVKHAYATTTARVTGYNTVPEQTDSTPCIGASGDDICGRTDVVACPRVLPLGTEVEIDGKHYTCLDRLNIKYDDRYDISCDKDMQCPRRVSGIKEIKIIIK